MTAHLGINGLGMGSSNFLFYRYRKLFGLSDRVWDKDGKRFHRIGMGMVGVIRPKPVPLPSLNLILTIKK